MDGFSHVIAHGAVQGFPRAVVSVSAHVAEELVAWEESVVCGGVCVGVCSVGGCGIIDCIGITGFSITCYVHCSRCIAHTIHRITTTHTITHTIIHIIPSQQRLRQRHVHERVAAPQVARQTLAQLCRTLVAVP